MESDRHKSRDTEGGATAAVRGSSKVFEVAPLRSAPFQLADGVHPAPGSAHTCSCAFLGCKTLGLAARLAVRHLAQGLALLVAGGRGLLDPRTELGNHAVEHNLPKHLLRFGCLRGADMRPVSEPLPVQPLEPGGPLKATACLPAYNKR